MFHFGESAHHNSWKANYFLNLVPELQSEIPRSYSRTNLGMGTMSHGLAFPAEGYGFLHVMRAVRIMVGGLGCFLIFGLSH